MTEELWQQTGHQGSIVTQSFPDWQQEALTEEEKEMLVQINSRPKVRLNLPADADTDTIKTLVLQNADVAALLCGAQPKKVIVVPGRLVNIIV